MDPEQPINPHPKPSNTTQNQITPKHAPLNTHFVPIQMATTKSGDGGSKKHHVPKSTLIIFWIFVLYLVLTIIAAVYFLTITKVKIFNLNNLASLSSNLSPSQSIDLPICVARTNKSALRSSVLENEYGGRVKSFDADISSQSADFHSTITIEKGLNNLFTYFIDKDEIKKTVFYNGTETKYRSIDGLEVGDSVVIRETINLRRPPSDSKTKIEVEVL